MTVGFTVHPDSFPDRFSSRHNTHPSKLLRSMSPCESLLLEKKKKKPSSASAVCYISGVGELMPEWSLFPIECPWLPLSEKAGRSTEGTS